MKSLANCKRKTIKKQKIGSESKSKRDINAIYLLAEYMINSMDNFSLKKIYEKKFYKSFVEINSRMMDAEYILCNLALSLIDSKNKQKLLLKRTLSDKNFALRVARKPESKLHFLLAVISLEADIAA